MNGLKQGTLYLTVSSVLFMVTGYFLNIFLGRLLGPVDYGIYGVLLTFLTLINIVQTSGVPQATSKLISQNEPDAIVFSSSFILQFLMSLLFFACTFFFSHYLASLLGDISIKPYIEISAFSFLTYGVFSLVLGYLNGQRKFVQQAMLSIFYYFFKTVLILLLALTYKLYGVLVGFVISPLLAFFFGFVIPKTTPNINITKKLFILSLPLVGFAFLSTFLQSIDIFLVNLYLPQNESIGFYAASQNISRIVFFGSSALPIIVFPLISKGLYDKNTQHSKAIVVCFFRYALLFVVPICLMISVKSSFVISLFYGSSYIAAATALSILAISYGVLTLYVLLANILNGAGKVISSLLIALVSVVISGALCIQLIPEFGITGAAMSTLIGNTFAFITAGVIVQQRFGRFINFFNITRIGLAGALAYAFGLIIGENYWINCFLFILVPTSFYLLLFAFKEIDQEDLILIRKLLKHKN